VRRSNPPVPLPTISAELIDLAEESSAYIKRLCDHGLEILEEKADLTLRENRRIGCTFRGFKMQANYPLLVHRYLDAHNNNYKPSSCYQNLKSTKLHVQHSN
jgi:hypothetical protein